MPVVCPWYCGRAPAAFGRAPAAASSAVSSAAAPTEPARTLHGRPAVPSCRPTARPYRPAPKLLCTQGTLRAGADRHHPPLQGPAATADRRTTILPPSIRPPAPPHSDCRRSRRPSKPPPAARTGRPTARTAAAIQTTASRSNSRPPACGYLSTLRITLRIVPSPTSGACASSGSRIVNWPGRSV